ncbi:uncharacterized protein TRIADDRAFT_56698 [Trichoplax adhaerens]|uniref:Uncharacterized protein n=1 Tax=Trichoplax adhaerens TaxID=10228 RepID=B3RWC3_TRIAD|nr:predicted protein [Trichoplax adhaerens]EDV25108.1 predicted protein [Trichoplax adhaerens]|eukprot:XP_002112998.1 predicted protein [Trichoplax adhaerens]
MDSAKTCKLTGKAVVVVCLLALIVIGVITASILVGVLQKNPNDVSLTSQNIPTSTASTLMNKNILTADSLKTISTAISSIALSSYSDISMGYDYGNNVDEDEQARESTIVASGTVVHEHFPSMTSSDRTSSVVSSN